MSQIRRSSNLILFSVLLVRTCFGQASQATCLPLFGSDALHPSGLFLQLGPLKPSTPHQNASSTYIYPSAQGAQVLWDATQGLTGVTVKALVAALKTELSTCVPKPAISSPGSPAQTPLMLGSHFLAIADFNNDGNQDAVVVTPGTNQVSVYLGKSDGAFQTPLQSTIGNASAKLAGVAIADFNNDQRWDLAVVDTANNAVYVALGKGDGTFGPPSTLTVGHSPASLTVADVNNDGNADIVVANTGDNTVSVMRGLGNGTFIPAAVFAVGKSPVSVIAQDMNGDGKPDLLVADSGSNDIAELLGFGNGVFQNAVFYKTPLPATYLASADFNNDGVPDIIALSVDANAVMSFTSNFQGKLTLAGSFLVPNLSASLSVNDFNGDGNLDLLIPDTDSGSAVLLLGRGDGTFTAPPVYGSNSGITSIVAGRFNNHVNTDLLITGSAGSNSTTSTLSLLAGLGNGQFQAPVNIPVPGPTNAVGVGDFNGDGRLDIAVSGAQLNILLGQANGSFLQGSQYPNIVPSVVADINKDGKLDIVGPMNGGIGVLLGNGDGTFRSTNLVPVGSNPKTAVVADFNNDRSIDIAVLNAGTPGNTGDPGGISILLGTGIGSFGAAINIPAGINPRALATADFNHDGKADLAVATSPDGSTFQIMVLLGNGDGTFQAPFNIPLPAGETPSTIAILDINGDGNPDIVVGDCCADSSTSYFLGNGDGTFQPPVAFYAGNSSRAIAVGDWNGDGKPDLALACSPADAPSVAAVVPLLNRVSNVQGLFNTSGASFMSGPIAPSSIVAAFGANLTNASAAATGDPSSLPTTLANTTVTVKDSQGVSRGAQLYYVSPGQINYLVPDATALGPATVAVTAPNGVTTAHVNVIAIAPGMFTANSSGLAAGSGVHVQGANQFAFNYYYVDPITGSVTLSPIDMGARNDRVILQLYGTGLRGRTSLAGVTVTIGNPTVGYFYTPALYAGPQADYPGLDQLNIQIPQVLANPGGMVTIQVSVDAVYANLVNVTLVTMKP